MHEHVCAFLQSVSEAFLLQGPIYEFGYSPSADLAGRPTPDSSFPEKGYLASGQSGAAEIDRLGDLFRLPFPDGAARTVISIDTLEHVFEPRQAAEEMLRILAPGGILLISSVSGVQLPGRPDRYWQPTPRALQRLLAGVEATLVGWQGADHSPHTLFAIASKPPVAETFAASVNRFLDGFQQRLNEAAARSGWWHRLRRRLMVWGPRKQEGESHLLPRTPADPGPTSEQRAECRALSRRDFHKAQFVLHLPVRRHLKHRLLAHCLPEENTGTRRDTSG